MGGGNDRCCRFSCHNIVQIPCQNVKKLFCVVSRLFARVYVFCPLLRLILKRGNIPRFGERVAKFSPHLSPLFPRGYDSHHKSGELFPTSVRVLSGTPFARANTVPNPVRSFLVRHGMTFASSSDVSRCYHWTYGSAGGPPSVQMYTITPVHPRQEMIPVLGTIQAIR